MGGERGVHPDCRNASNPYHECVDFCFRVIAEAKARSAQNNKGDFFFFAYHFFHVITYSRWWTLVIFDDNEKFESRFVLYYFVLCFGGYMHWVYAYTQILECVSVFLREECRIAWRSVRSSLYVVVLKLLFWRSCRYKQCARMST